MKIISKQKFKEQQIQDKLISLITPKTTDRTEFEIACQQFRNICEEIRKFLNIDEFKGGFDEIMLFQNSPIANTNEGLFLAMKWNAANNLCTYLANKLGIGQPDWWKECWQLR